MSLQLCFLLSVFVEIAVPTGIPTKEAKAEMETHPVTVEAKISKCSL